MAILSWGKPKISYAPSVDGQPTNNWQEFDTPQENSTQLNTTEGDSKEAKEEGGAIVDSVYNVSDYTLTFALFVKKSSTGTVTLPLDPHDGKVSGEYAIKLQPEDPACPGFQFDATRITVATSYSTEYGLLATYTCKGLKPKEGDICKIQVIS